MLTEREMEICRKACAILKDCGEYLLPEASLRGHMRRAVSPAASTAEVDDCLRHLDDQRRIHATRNAETGNKYALTDLGRSWYAQNS